MRYMNSINSHDYAFFTPWRKCLCVFGKKAKQSNGLWSKTVLESASASASDKQMAAAKTVCYWVGEGRLL